MHTHSFNPYPVIFQPFPPRGPICQPDLWHNSLADTLCLCTEAAAVCVALITTSSGFYLSPPARPHSASGCTAVRVCMYICVCFWFICTCRIMCALLYWCLEISEGFLVNVCVLVSEFAYRCEDKRLSLCSTFSSSLAQSVNEANILLKWRRRRMHPVPFVMWSDPHWAFHIKVEWACLPYTSDVLLSQPLPLGRQNPCCANTEDYQGSNLGIHRHEAVAMYLYKGLTAMENNREI